MSKSSKSNLSLQSSIFFTLVFLFFVLNLFAYYSGTYHGSLMNTWQFVLGKYPYTNDVFLQNNIFTETSIIFKIFSYFKIDMANDYVGFSFHIILSTLSGIFLFKILKEFTSIADTKIILIILFSILAIDGKYFLVDANYSSWIIRHTGTTSQIGHSLVFIFFWALLKEKRLTLVVLSSLMLLISVKSTFFSIGIGIAYSLFNYSDLKSKLWILSPILTVLYLGGINVYSEANDFEIKKILFDHLIVREGEEASFHLQPKIKLFLFTISFPIFYFLAKKVNNIKFRKLSFIVLVFSILCFIWGYFYHLYGGLYYPEPKLAALGPTRAVEIYELFFALLIALFITKTNFSNLNKTCLYACLFYIPFGINGVFLSLSIITLFILINLIVNKINLNFFDKIIKEKSSNFSYLISIIFFLLLFPSTIYTISKKNFDFYGLKTINKWKTGPLYKNKNRIDSAVLLRDCDDFVLLDPIGKSWTNLISGKSQYMDFTRLGINLFSIKLHNIMKIRTPVYNDIVDSIKNDTLIKKETQNQLIKDNVVLLIKKENIKSFPKNIYKKTLNSSDVLVLFLDKQKIDRFNTTCTSKF